MVEIKFNINWNKISLLIIILLIASIFLTYFITHKNGFNEGFDFAYRDIDDAMLSDSVLQRTIDGETYNLYTINHCMAECRFQISQNINQICGGDSYEEN